MDGFAAGFSGVGRGAGWRDALLNWRDRRIADPRFRRWAATFPLTRPIARRRARALFDLCAGFVYSQVLLACVRLRLFDLLAERPRTSAELAAILSLPRDSADRLLAAAVSLRLVSRRGNALFALGPLGAALVGNDGIAEMILHHPMLYHDLSDPVALLRGESERTQLGAFWPYASTERPDHIGDTVASRYTALMAASQPLVADEVLSAYDLRRHRCLLDLGGGDGSFLAAAAAGAPALQLVLFDLPAVAERARLRLDAANLSGRARTVGGNFLSDELPRGADVVSLVRVIHDHDDAGALAILRAARQAMPSGGTLLLAEPMAETGGAEPIGDAYFGFYLLAMGRGRPRTPAALTALLLAAGFTRVRLRPTRTPLLVRVLTALSP